MGQPGDGDRQTVCLGAAQDDQAGLGLANGQQPGLLRARQGRLDRVRRLPQRRPVQQIMGGRGWYAVLAGGDVGRGNILGRRSCLDK